jgi:predicted enzyme related to lactoylglutathione lyase
MVGGLRFPVAFGKSPTRRTIIKNQRSLFMNRVIHFEFAAENPERAANFYKSVFGWEATNWGGPQEYWLVKTGPDDKPGINGGILRQQDAMPKTVNTVEVASIEEFIEKIKRNGGKVAVPKMAIPGVGYQAYCLDTEGNLFGIHKPDPAAK